MTSRTSYYSDHDTSNGLITEFHSDVVNNLTSLHVNCKGRPLRLNFVLLLMIAGDINPNPGPVNSKSACNICLRTVAKNHRAVSCDTCDSWLHIRCEGISPKRYKSMISLSEDNKLSYVCQNCHLDCLPFPEGMYDSDTDFSDHCEPIPNDFDPYKFIKNKKGLKFAHLNINGIRSKIEYLTLFLQETKLDILCLNESKVDLSINDAEISVPNYNIFRRDRNKHGGGVLVYCKDNLHVKVLKHLCSTKHESIWLEIKQNKNSPFYLCSIYRPPSRSNEIEMVNSMCTYLTECLTKLPRKIPEVFILGDINCDMNRTYTLSSIIKDFLQAH